MTVTETASFATADELQSELVSLRDLIVRQHQSLFVAELDDFIVKVHLFGFYFASLDIRQSSDVFFASLCEVLSESNSSAALTRAQRDLFLSAEFAQQVPLELLEQILQAVAPLPRELITSLSPLTRDTLEVLALIPEVQSQNGELGLHRIVVSHTRGPEDMLVVLILARLAGIAPRNFAVDVVPLFESIEDLDNAEHILTHMLNSTVYQAHLNMRPHQVIMVGFSDGTKDGGYLAANWSIRDAKRQLTTLGRRRNVPIVFFDGRGGPPARGGGNTHQFYRSRDNGIEQLQTQLTIQGQTISSNFGSRDMGRYHVEQLFTANLENLLFPSGGEDPPAHHRALMDEMATLALRTYRELRDDPKLLKFLMNCSPLPLFDHLTIASRPVTRRLSQRVKPRENCVPSRSSQRSVF